MTQKKFKFEEFELDVLKRQLKREGEIVPLNPKAFELLFALVENNGKLLSKDDLFRLVWEDQIVEESNLTVNMSAIRRALGEKASQPRFITTVSGQGYRFVGDVRESNGQAAEETIIESRTLARIVVEEVVETNEKTAAGISPVVKLAALPPAPESFFKRHRPAVAGSVLILALILGIGGYLRQKEAAKSFAPWQAISMKRLTNLGNVTNAALSPDGKLFAYTLQEKDGRRSLWLGHVDGGENVNLRPASDITIHGIAFAPDGGSLFYIITSAEFERGALFKTRVFGGAPEKIRENIENFIAFSPDGKQFVFVRGDRENRKSSLMMTETDGVKEREIASRPINLSFIATSPAWSPDGKFIAVSAIADESASTNEIFVVGGR